AGIPAWTVVVGAQHEARIGDGTLVSRASFLWQDEVQLVEGLPGFLVRNPDGSIADATAAVAAGQPFTREVKDLTASLGYELDNCSTAATWALSSIRPPSRAAFRAIRTIRGLTGPRYDSGGDGARYSDLSARAGLARSSGSEAPSAKVSTSAIPAPSTASTRG